MIQNFPEAASLDGFQPSTERKNVPPLLSQRADGGDQSRGAIGQGWFFAGASWCVYLVVEVGEVHVKSGQVNREIENILRNEITVTKIIGSSRTTSAVPCPKDFAPMDYGGAAFRSIDSPLQHRPGVQLPIKCRKKYPFCHFQETESK